MTVDVSGTLSEPSAQALAELSTIILGQKSLDLTLQRIAEIAVRAGARRPSRHTGTLPSRTWPEPTTCSLVTASRAGVRLAGDGEPLHRRALALGRGGQ